MQNLNIKMLFCDVKLLHSISRFQLNRIRLNYMLIIVFYVVALRKFESIEFLITELDINSPS